MLQTVLVLRRSNRSILCSLHLHVSSIRLLANYLKLLEQDVRDKGLDRLIQSLVKEQRWVDSSKPEKKMLRVIWKGLFFSKSRAIASDLRFVSSVLACRQAPLLEGHIS